MENGNIFSRPNPFPVSEALNVEIKDAVLRGDVEEAIRIINTAHGDGNMPVIPVKMNNRLRMADAQLFTPEVYRNALK